MTDKILSDISYFFLTLIVPLFAGYAIGMKKILSDRFMDRLMDWNMLFLSTLLTLIVFWKMELSAALAALPALGLLMQVIPGIAAFIIVKKKFTGSLERGSYLLSAIFANRTITGLLTVYIFFGETGYGLGRIVMLLGPVAFYMFGMPLSKYYRSENDHAQAGSKSVLKFLFDIRQLPLLGIIAGVALNRCGIARPPVLGDIFPAVFAVNMWLFALPVGTAIRFTELRAFWKKTADLLFIKFIIVPVLVYPAALLSGFEPVTMGTVMILSFTPSAIGAVIMAKMYGLNTHLAMAAYLLTTGFYLAVIFPLMLALAYYLR